MTSKKNHLYYQTPLSASKTIDLPSNLLQARPSTRYKDLSTINATTVTPRTNLQHLPAANNAFVEEKKPKKSVLYKRLSAIQNKNEELEKYSYSKMLSKMIVVDDQKNPFRSVDYDERMRANSEYSCLRGRLISIDAKQQESSRYEDGGQHKEKKKQSGLRDYANRTTRIFKRMYAGSEKNASFFKEQPVGQKYIYINGKKTQCKRIHNFYTSQNYKTSYSKAFGKTRPSFRAF